MIFMYLNFWVLLLEGKHVKGNPLFWHVICIADSSYDRIRYFWTLWQECYHYNNIFLVICAWLQRNMTKIRYCVWPPGLCTTRDIDFLLNHINNSRYLRAMDFGRVDHCIRSGIWRTLSESRSKLLVAATTIRYRKPVFLFVPYRLQSQVSIRVCVDRESECRG